MTTETEPTLALDLVRIHRVITRGLSTGMEKGSQFRQEGFSETTLQQGFCDYIRSLVTVLSGHHQAEDMIAFPVLREKLPQAPYDHLAADHKQIEAMLVDLNRALDEMIDVPADGLDWIVDGLNSLKEVWAPHIRMEESIFCHEAICEVMSAVEQMDLSARMGKYGKEHSNPPGLVLPFVLFNLEGEDRASYLANMPANIMEDLVMKTWKEQWAPMKPFLLE